jgi:hypothetical protein
LDSISPFYPDVPAHFITSFQAHTPDDGITCNYTPDIMENYATFAWYDHWDEHSKVKTRNEHWLEDSSEWRLQQIPMASHK